MPDYNSSHTGQEIDASVDITQSLAPVSEIFSGGFFDYNDLATQTTPISVTGGAGFVVITNDGLGPFTNKTYRPSSVSEIFNTTTNQFDFTDLKLGDMIDFRFDIEITTTSPNQDIEFDLFLGVGAGEYVIPIVSGSIKSAGVHTLNRFTGIYMGDNNTLLSPGELKISSPDNCTVKNNGVYAKIIKRGA